MSCFWRKPAPPRASRDEGMRLPIAVSIKVDLYAIIAG
jgi:hypothetical protein